MCYTLSWSHDRNMKKCLPMALPRCQELMLYNFSSKYTINTNCLCTVTGKYKLRYWKRKWKKRLQMAIPAIDRWNHALWSYPNILAYVQRVYLQHVAMLQPYQWTSKFFYCSWFQEQHKFDKKTRLSLPIHQRSDWLSWTEIAEPRNYPLVF